MYSQCRRTLVVKIRDVQYLTITDCALFSAGEYTAYRCKRLPYPLRHTCGRPWVYIGLRNLWLSTTTTIIHELVFLTHSILVEDRLKRSLSKASGGYSTIIASGTARTKLVTIIPSDLKINQKQKISGKETNSTANSKCPPNSIGRRRLWYA